MKLVDFTAQAMVFQQKVGFGGGLIYIYYKLEHCPTHAAGGIMRTTNTKPLPLRIISRSEENLSQDPPTTLCGGLNTY